MEVGRWKLEWHFSATVDIGSVVVEHDDTWDAEEERIAWFVACGCSCQHANKKTPCHRLFTADEYRTMRGDCRELTQDELDLVIMGQLSALTQSDATTQKQKASNTERVCSSTQCISICN